MKEQEIPSYLDPTKNSIYKRLKEAFPDLYENVYCGVSICEGWFNLVYKLSEDITNLMYAFDKNASLKVAQVKQKFCGLRFYVDCNIEDEKLSDEIYHLITKAESESTTICEFCGDSAEPKTYGLLLCQDCETKNKDRWSK